MSADDESLIDLLERWEEAWQQGILLSAEELCAECPERVDQLKRLIEKRQQLGKAFPLAGQPTGDGPVAGPITPRDARNPNHTPREGQEETRTTIVPWPTLPGYEILKELKRTGMSIVYKARHLELKRPVALKMILEGWDPDPRWLARLLRDAETLAQLRHPNIVPIYAVGEDQGLPFLCLEFVESGSLADHLDGTPLLPDRAAQLVELLARAIHYVHQHGIIHRDLKPANVLLACSDRADAVVLRPDSKDIERYEPKLTDFGLAKWLDQPSGLTPPGAILGTASYMAPEQARGRNDEVGVPADVYGLGAILYELLTGRPPFKAATIAETLTQVVSEEPVRPSRLQRKIPRDLEAITLKCLEKAPSRRYASAEQLADELRHYLKREPLQHTRRVLWLERVGRWCRRKPALATAGCLAAVLLAAGIVVPTLFAVQNSQHVQDLTDVLQKRDQAVRDLKHQLAVNHLNQGLAACEQGNIGLGLLRFTHSLKEAPEDDPGLQRVIRTNLSGWERQLHSLTQCLAHKEEILAVAFSPDGRTVVTGSADGMARLWRTDTGEPFCQFRHAHPVQAVAFSPDGATVLTGCADGRARFWDVATRTRTGPVLHHHDEIRAVAYHPKGKLVVTGSADATAQLWDAETGEPVGAPLQHKEAVEVVAFGSEGQTILTGGAQLIRSWKTASAEASGPDIHFQSFRIAAGPDPKKKSPIRRRDVTFSPDGQFAVTGSQLGALQLWEIATGKPRPDLALPRTGQVTAIAFSGDGRYLLVGNPDRTAHLWEIATHQMVGQPLPHGSEVQALAIGPSSRFVLTGGKDGTARLWETALGKDRTLILHHGGCVRHLAFRFDGAEVLTGGNNRLVKLWNAHTGKQHQPILRHEKSVSSIAYSPNGQVIFTGDWGGNAQFWNAATGEPLGAPLRHRDKNRYMNLPVAISPDGTVALTANRATGVKLWAVPGGPVLNRPRWPANGVTGVVFSPDSQLILTVDAKQPIARFWTVATGKWFGPPLHHDKAILTMAFSPDGQIVATGSADRTARLWKVATGGQLGAPLRHEGPVWVVALSPDGHSVLTGSEDFTARLWDVETGKQRIPALHQQGSVHAVGFSPDGQTLLTASEDKTARLWDTGSGKLLGPPLVHRSPIWAALFSPTGDRVLTGGDDGTARLWPVPTPLQGRADRIALWIQVTTGMELDDNDVVHVLDAPTWKQRRQWLRDQGGPPGM